MNKIKTKFLSLLKSDGSLSQRAARGGIWVVSSFTFGKILNFIQTIILVRLLLPSDFGLMSLASVAIGAMVVFTETGIAPAIIQRKELSESTLNTAWIISIIRGFLLFILLFIFSPFIANFYKNNQLEGIIKVIGSIFLLNGLNNIGTILFSKELDFKKKSFFEQIVNILAFIVTVSLAFILRNVWALVIGQVFLAAATLIVSYLIHPFRPLLKFNFRIAEELFKFGKHIFGAGVIIFIITNGDNALIGKVLGMSALGFYALAYNLSNMPATAITHVISQVSFPAYAKLQDDIPRLREAYKKVLRFTCILSIPLAGGLFVLAPEFVRIVYGEKWLPMVPAMQVLCLFGIIRSIVATTGPLFQSVGKPHILTKVSFAQMIILAIIIYPLTSRFNVVGTSTATLVALMAVQWWAIIQVSKIIEGSVTSILKELSLPFIGSLVMVGAIFIVKMYLQPIFSFGWLLCLILFGGIIYAAVINLFKKETFSEIYQVVKSI